MTDAFNFANLRVKREYSGLRRSGLKQVRLLNEADKEYENDVIESPRMNIETISTESNKDTKVEKDNETLNDEEYKEFCEFIEKAKPGKKPYKVVVTVGRKPRKRDLDGPCAVIFANSIPEAEDEIIKEFANDGISLKKKWIQVLPTTPREIINMDSFKAWLKKQNSSMIAITDTLSDSIFRHNQLKDKYIMSDYEKHGTLRDAKGATSILNEDGFIEEIEVEFNNPKDRKITDFLVTLTTSYHTQYPSIKVKAATVGNAIAYVLVAVKHQNVSYKYTDIESVGVLNKKTGQLLDIDFKAIKESKGE